SCLPPEFPSGTYMIKNVNFDTMYMSAYLDSPAIGNPVLAFGFIEPEDPAQFWTVSEQDNAYTITCAGTGTSLDAKGGDDWIGQSIVTDNILRTFNLYGTNGQYQILLTDSNLALTLATSISSDPQQLWSFEQQ
ncbi:carbohydrate-binding module family 13 protein, partial [Postia placenta MAD-698-R-SB12]